MHRQKPKRKLTPVERLQKDVQKMYHAPDSQIPKRVVIFLARLIRFYRNYPELIGLRKTPIPMTIDMKDEINARLSVLKEGLERGDVNEADKVEVLKRLIADVEKEVTKRRKIIQECKVSLAPQSIPYYLSYTNLNQYTIGIELKRFWAKLDSLGNKNCNGECGLFNLKAGKLSEEDISLQLHLLSEKLATLEKSNWDTGQELRYEFDGFKFAIDQYYSHREDKLHAKHGFSHSKLFALNDFEHCLLCWRFVPKQDHKYNKKPYCVIHSYDPASKVPQTNYNLALEFNRNEDESQEGGDTASILPLYKTDIKNMRLLDEHFPLEGGGLRVCMH